MKSEASILRSLEMVALALLALLGVYVIFTATAWQLQARLFPWVVAAPVLLVAVVQLVITARSRVSESVTEEHSHADEIGIWNPDARRETFRLIGWMVLFLGAIALFSFLIGLPLAMLLYLRFESKEKWLLSVILAAATWVYLYFVFDQVLHLPWPDGIITGLFNR